MSTMAIYGIITRDPTRDPGTGKSQWRFANPGPDKWNSELLKLLNELGGQGWDVVGVGEFGGGQGDEIILRK
jgi:hypothetical protein